MKHKLLEITSAVDATLVIGVCAKCGADVPFAVVPRPTKNQPDRLGYVCLKSRQAGAKWLPGERAPGGCRHDSKRSNGEWMSNSMTKKPNERR